MNFWTIFAAYLAVTALVYVGLSLNGKSEQAGHGAHDDHAHGHGGHH